MIDSNSEFDDISMGVVERTLSLFEYESQIEAGACSESKMSETQ